MWLVVKTLVESLHLESKLQSIDQTKFEVFLTAVKKSLLKEAFINQRFERLNKKKREIYEVLQRLKIRICLCSDKKKIQQE